MAVALSRFFRYSLNRDQSPLAPLEEEAEMVKEYLTIEKIRFEDRLVFTMDLAASAKSLKIPRNVLQPLVENGIKHGFEQSQGICQLHLKAWTAAQDPYLTISVSDNGKPFPEDLRPGFGLQSLQDKLRLLFPQQHEVIFQNHPSKQLIIRFYHAPHV
jgi:LytS/YehU family sensor histidine kinase